MREVVELFVCGPRKIILFNFFMVRFTLVIGKFLL